MPMQYYSAIPEQQASISHFGYPATLSNIYSRPNGRIYQLPMENSQLYQLENPARPLMHQILPQQATQYSPWQGAATPTMTHQIAQAQFVDAGAPDYSSSWYQKHLETQAQLQCQTNPRTWSHSGQGFQVGQMMSAMPSNMLPLQQGRMSMARTGPYADFENDTGQYNIPDQHYMFVSSARQDGL